MSLLMLLLLLQVVLPLALLLGLLLAPAASLPTIPPSEIPKVAIRCKSSRPVRMPFGLAWFRAASWSSVKMASCAR